MSSFLFRRSAASRAEYDESTRAAVLAAQEEAVALRHAVVRSEHFLLGVLAAEGPGRDVLEAGFGLDLETARRDVSSALPPGTKSPRGGPAFDASTRPVLERAAEAARGLGAGRVTSGHLLLGLLAAGGGAAALLAGRGVDPGAVRRALVGAVPGEVAAPPPAPVPGGHRVVALEGDPAEWEAQLDAIASEGWILVGVTDADGEARAVFRRA